MGILKRSVSVESGNFAHFVLFWGGFTVEKKREWRGVGTGKGGEDGAVGCGRSFQSSKWESSFNPIKMLGSLIRKFN